MPVRTLVSPEEYLKTSFEDGDREYVDGELVKRGMPTYLHGKVQALICMQFTDLVKSHSVFAVTEVRHALNPEHLYRIPDIAVFAGEEPTGPVPVTPPLIAIEIASPDDRLTETLKKFEEYRHWGITHIWLIDPEDRKLYTYDKSGLHPVPALNVPRFELTIALSDLGL